MPSYIGTYATDGHQSYITAQQVAPAQLPVLILPAPRPTALPPPPAPVPAAPAVSPCSGCGKGTPAPAPAAPAPAPVPSSSSSPVGLAPAPAAAVLSRLQADAGGGVTEPRDPRELLAWLEENGGLSLWIILAIILLAIWSRRGGGSQTWR